MKRPQVSTNVGSLSILGGFLQVFGKVKLMNFWSVFQGLTFNELIAIIIPFIAGIWAILHNEKRE